MAGPFRIEVVGLKEFAAALRKAEGRLPAEIKEVYNAAGDLVVETAVPMMEQQFVSVSSRLDGALERSVRSQPTRTEGRVIEGYPSRVPYAGWWEFGGSTKVGGGPRVHRAFIKGGRALFPALRKVAPKITVAMEEAMERLHDIIELG